MPKTEEQETSAEFAIPGDFNEKWQNIVTTLHTAVVARQDAMAILSTLAKSRGLAERAITSLAEVPESARDMEFEQTYAHVLGLRDTYTAKIDSVKATADGNQEANLARGALTLADDLGWSAEAVEFLSGLVKTYDETPDPVTILNVAATSGKGKRSASPGLFRWQCQIDGCTDRSIHDSGDKGNLGAKILGHLRDKHPATLATLPNSNRTVPVNVVTGDTPDAAAEQYVYDGKTPLIKLWKVA